MPDIVKVTLILIVFIMLFTFLLNSDYGLVLYRKLKCKLGFHDRKTKLIHKTIRKYRCKNCGKPREDVELKVINGGKKEYTNTFKW